MISLDMALVEVTLPKASVSLTPYFQTTEDDVLLPTSVAARAIEKARWYCKGHAAVCSSNEEMLASFVRELVAVNLLKVRGYLDLGCRKIAGMIWGEKSEGFRGSLGSRKASRPPRGRSLKALRPLLVAVKALFFCISKCKDGMLKYISSFQKAKNPSIVQ